MTRKRALACIACQQRKVKCDRKFPCASCIKLGVSCAPASLAPRRSKRRFSERELLDRIRKYESLLNQNGIAFERHYKKRGETNLAAEAEQNRKANGVDELHPTTGKAEQGFVVKYAFLKRNF